MSRKVCFVPHYVCMEADTDVFQIELKLPRIYQHMADRNKESYWQR